MKVLKCLFLFFIFYQHFITSYKITIFHQILQIKSYKIPYDRLKRNAHASEGQNLWKLSLYRTHIISYS